MSGVIAGISIAAIGLGLSAYGTVQQANAAKDAANYQSKVAAGNEQVAAQNATAAGAAGEAKAAISEQKTRAAVGAELAAQGSSGVDINSSTARAVRTSEDMTGQLDAQTIRSNAARQAYGYEVQGSGFQNNAAADTSTGKNDSSGGYIGAGSGLLTGAGREAMNYASVMNKSSGVQDYSSPIGPSMSGPAMGQELS